LRTLGVVHLARKEPELAIERLDTALREKQHLRPGDVEFTRFHLAKAYLELDKEREARSQLQLIENGKTLYAEKARELLRSLGTPKAA
jgi:FimV-like protein